MTIIRDTHNEQQIEHYYLPISSFKSNTDLNIVVRTDSKIAIIALNSQYANDCKLYYVSLLTGEGIIRKPIDWLTDKSESNVIIQVIELSKHYILLLFSKGFISILDTSGQPLKLLNSDNAYSYFINTLTMKMPLLKYKRVF